MNNVEYVKHVLARGKMRPCPIGFKDSARLLVGRDPLPQALEIRLWGSIPDDTSK